MILSDSKSKVGVRQKSRVIYFGDPTWGFSDAAVPKLRELFGPTDLHVDIDHSGVMIECVGERSELQFAEASALVERAAAMPEFQNCVMGTAEGEAASPVDIWSIKAAAMRNTKQS